MASPAVRLVLGIHVGQRQPVCVAERCSRPPARRPSKGGEQRGEGTKWDDGSAADAPPAPPEAARGHLWALGVHAQQLSSSISRAFVTSAAYHFGRERRQSGYFERSA